MRRRTFTLGILVVALMAPCVSGFAEDIFGVPVYPGANPAHEITKFLKQNFKQQGAAFRTSDAVEKVAEFYKTQGIVKMVSIEKESAFFTKGSYELNVTIQNPWVDVKTGKRRTDTLITISKVE